MPERHSKYGEWALRVLTWDAVLPVCVALAPVAVKFLFPNNRGAIELTAVLVPVAAFPLRAWAGIRHIKANNCSYAAKMFQLCVFLLGILPLVLWDSVVILSHVMPEGALDNRMDRMVLLVGSITYLLLMTIAMYPGRTESPRADPEDLLAYRDDWLNEGRSGT
jgi:hypothetical protein